MLNIECYNELYFFFPVLNKACANSVESAGSKRQREGGHCEVWWRGVRGRGSGQAPGQPRHSGGCLRCRDHHRPAQPPARGQGDGLRGSPPHRPGDENTPGRTTAAGPYSRARLKYICYTVQGLIWDATKLLYWQMSPSKHCVTKIT